LKNEKSNQGKLDIYFKKNGKKNRAQNEDLNKQAKVIQDYVKKRNNRWRYAKVANLFNRLKYKVASRRLINFSHLQKLKDQIQKVYLRKLLHYIKDREKLKKLSWFFIKRLSKEDEKFKDIFLKKIFN